MSDTLKTVAVWLPGTDRRVLVDRIDASDADAVAVARGVISEVAEHLPTARACITRVDDITNVTTEVN